MTGRDTSGAWAATCAVTCGAAAVGWRSWARSRWTSNTTPLISMRRWQSRAWAGSGWPGRRSSPHRRPRRFYTEVARWAAASGRLRLIFLRVDGRPVAFHLALEDGRTYFPLKGGFDPAFRAQSPGRLLIHATLERAFAIGLRRYEFLGGGDAYKLRWATEAYDRVLFHAFAPGPVGRARWVAFAHGRPMAKRAIGELRRRFAVSARRSGH